MTDAVKEVLPCGQPWLYHCYYSNQHHQWWFVIIVINIIIIVLISSSLFSSLFFSTLQRCVYRAPQNPEMLTIQCHCYCESCITVIVLFLYYCCCMRVMVQWTKLCVSWTSFSISSILSALVLINLCFYEEDYSWSHEWV